MSSYRISIALLLWFIGLVMPVVGCAVSTPRAAEVFSAEIQGCRIEWRATAASENGAQNSLQVRRENCPLPFAEQLPLHRTILKQITARRPLADFASISWSSFGNAADWSWNLPVAVASSKSKAYRVYRAGRNGGGEEAINTIFVNLADEVAAYEELRSLMREFAVDVRLVGVEKVFAGKAKNLPWAAALKERGVSANATVIYDVGSAYFKIAPWPTVASEGRPH